MATSRRKFVQAALAAAAAGCFLRSGPLWGEIHGITYGVQLFMLRRQAATDLAGVFNLIKSAGFEQVELYPIAYKGSAAELRRMIAAAGLGAVSGHFDYDGLEGRLDYARDLGLKYVVCPMLPKDQWASLDGFKQAADLFNRVGEGARARGMEFAFHNHCYEFRPMEGSRGFDVLMQHTDPKLVKLELDMYWLTQAGQHPVAMMRAHADRLRLVHLKDRLAGAAIGYDMNKSAEHFTELGRGTIAWSAILKQAKSQGVKYAFLDQDETTLPFPESLQISRDYLRRLHA